MRLIKTLQASLNPMVWENPMGEARKDTLGPDCWGRIGLSD